MILRPKSREELSQALAAASTRGEKITDVDLGALNRVIEHSPEDMTVTVEAGLTLAELQAQLAQRGQWLPIDPPQPERLTIADVLNENLNGPRRFGYGTIREHLIGLKAALADGRVIQSGGKVVKNVAGYDLQKLFIGARGSLGVIVEANFKLRPLPEAEAFVEARSDSLARAGELIEAVVTSELTPVVLDFHNLAGRGVHAASGSEARPAAKRPEDRASFTLCLGFAGTREEVDWQSAKAADFGISEASSLAHESNFWAEAPPGEVRTVSVLPSKLVEMIQTLGEVPFAARAGNGVIHYRGGPSPPKREQPRALSQRLKDAFDPKHIFPDLDL